MVLTVTPPPPPTTTPVIPAIPIKCCIYVYAFILYYPYLLPRSCPELLQLPLPVMSLLKSPLHFLGLTSVCFCLCSTRRVLAPRQVHQHQQRERELRHVQPARLHPDAAVQPLQQAHSCHQLVPAAIPRLRLRDLGAAVRSGRTVRAASTQPRTCPRLQCCVSAQRQ